MALAASPGHLGVAYAPFTRTIDVQGPHFNQAPRRQFVPSSLSRTQIAHRIHDLMLGEIGHGIQIERLLGDARYARDVLLVCDACVGSELMALAVMFRDVTANLPAHLTETVPDRHEPPGYAQQPNEWARDTSGFGLTQPPPLALDPRGRDDSDFGPATVERRRSWLGRWRKE